MMSAPRRTALVVLALAAAVAGARAQEDPVRWTAVPAAARVDAGATLEVRLTAAIDQGWHIYAIAQPPGGPIPTSITIVEGQPFARAAAIREPAPVRRFDPNFDIQTEFHEESPTFVASVRAAGDAAAGPHELTFRVRFQACTDTVCLPPIAKLVAVRVHVLAVREPAAATAGGDPRAAPPVSGPLAAAPAAPAAVPAGAVAEPTTIDTSAVAVEAGSLRAFLVLAMSMGALSLLTPCVFPMVPITVSYFTNHAAGRRRGAIANAVIYAGGIIATFTALGTALAMLVGASGMNLFAANPWINLLITAIFLGFALSLFGAYEIRLPSRLLTGLDRLSRREGPGAAGTLLMALTFTLTSFTCTAPFVGTLFVMAAGGRWQWPVAGMLAFSSVFALPFFVLALVPQLVSQLPRAGAWLNAVKVSMGFLEIAAAMKFISNVDLVWGWHVFTREVVLATWVAIGVLLTLYLLGVFRVAEGDAPVQRVGAVRIATALLTLAVSFHLLTGLWGSRLGEIEAFLPPATGGGAGRNATGTIDGELPWIVNDYDGALAAARQEKKLLLIDFTGYTCTNCRWMEANMFPRPDVRRELERYVRVRLYTDGEGEPYQQFQKFQASTFKTVALPYYAVISGDGRPLTTFPGLTRNPQQFVAFLRAPLERERAATGGS